MSDDNIPTGRAVEVTPNSKMAAVLIRLRRNGWMKRQGVKVAGFAAAAAAGYFASHGGQEYAAEIAGGVGALVLFGWEFIWSWVEFKASNVKIVEALNTEPPETRVEAMVEMRKLAAKDPKPPITPVIIFLLLCILPAACKSSPPQAGNDLIPYEDPADKPWKTEIDMAINERLTSRYQPQ